MTTAPSRRSSLVIGAGGFVGPYLVNELLVSSERDVHVTVFPSEDYGDSRVVSHHLDVCDGEAVKKLVLELNPDEVYHLAALSSVAASWNDPARTVDVNIKGAIHVLEAARLLEPMPRVLLVGSSEEYGGAARERSTLGEDSPVQPMNVYALTKSCQNTLGCLYFSAYGVPVVMVRAFNHIGPGQSQRFVASDFCRQVALIEAGRQEAVIRVGNLSSLRDFADVRDIVRAYVQVAVFGTAGETYNVGSGRVLSIGQLLDRILALTPVAISVTIDQCRYRPVDIPAARADIRKVQDLCQWNPVIGLDQTLEDMLVWWRARLG